MSRRESFFLSLPLSALRLLGLCSVLSSCFSNGSQWIDKDTKSDAFTTIRRHDGKVLDLVMSDEFNTEGRGFLPGEDDIWEAITAPDYTNAAIEFYNGTKEYVTTRDGNLVLTVRAEKTYWEEWNATSGTFVSNQMNYTSGMIQSWNKFCHTGGVVEFSVRLPGLFNSSGLWSAVWLMGNLGRAIYTNSSEYIWPWSYDKCDSEVDLDQQLINACNPNPGYGFHPHQGRGAPEIDIFEIMQTQWKWNGIEQYIPAYISTSYQVSPGTPFNEITRPQVGQPVWGYTLPNGTWVSTYWYQNWTVGGGGYGDFGGFPGVYNEFYGKINGPEVNGVYGDSPRDYVQDSLSINTPINGSLWESHHTYRIEWQPEGYIDWYVDDVFLFGLPQESLTEKTGSLISVEPSYLIANIAMGTGWGINSACDVDSTCAAVCNVCMDCHNPTCQCGLPEGMKNCAMFPSEMLIDYVRIYQDKSDSLHTVGCSPPNYPTEGYIKGNPGKYVNWDPYYGFNKPIEYTGGVTIETTVGSFIDDLIMSMCIMGLLIAGYIYYHKNSTASRVQYTELPNVQ